MRQTFIKITVEIKLLQVPLRPSVITEAVKGPKHKMLNYLYNMTIDLIYLKNEEQNPNIVKKVLRNGPSPTVEQLLNAIRFRKVPEQC